MHTSSAIPAGGSARARGLIVPGIVILCALALYAGFGRINNDYIFVAGYTVLQFVVLGTAWNILGGYAGYVNFGSAGFFAVGAYTTVALHKAFGLPMLPCIAAAACTSGLLGLGTGYLTLRLRGVFFSIATLALSVVLATIVANWDYLGGARGVYIMRPMQVPVFGSYVRYLFAVMLALVVISVLIARLIERSTLGQGLAALRDDEAAAECAGVPSLRLKLIATIISGGLMGAAGAPFPFFITYIDPSTVFALSIAVNAIAMPMIGGTQSWVGPVIGGLLLGSVQQVASVTISSSLSLLIVGLLLVGFITFAPTGLVGLARQITRRRR